jgi:DNA anti-recombination protein RmuC
MVLIAAALAFIVAPMFRADARQQEQVSQVLSEARELQSQHDMLMASLKDLEDDRAQEKIAQEDYDEFKAKTTTRIVALMKRLDELKQEHARPAGPRAVNPPAEPAG